MMFGTMTKLTGKRNHVTKPQRPLMVEELESRDVPTVPSGIVVDPSGGAPAGGQVVTLAGADLVQPGSPPTTQVTSVNFGATQVAVDNGDVVGGTIQIAQPALAIGVYQVTVTTPEGTSTPGPESMYIVGPQVYELSPASPPSGGTAGGTELTLWGARLTGATAVNFVPVGGGAAQLGTNIVVSASGTSLTVTTPALAVGVYNITVTTAEGTSNVDPDAQFTAGATVTGVSPITTTSGNTVTITGFNLTGATAVNFGNQQVTSGITVSPDGTSLTVTAPTLFTGIYDVSVVTAANGTSLLTAESQLIVNPLNFTFENDTNLGTTPIYVAMFGELGYNTAIGAGTIESGVVTGFDLTYGGGGYTVPPTVTFAPPPPGGTTATGTAIIDANGIVTGVTITNGGSGYGGDRIGVTFSSGGLLNNPLTATGTAILGGNVGQIDSIIVTNAGAGYSSTPTVVITGTGTGATATAQMSGDGTQVQQVIVTNPGSGYTEPPTISFVGGSPTTAAAATAVGGGTVTGVTITNPGGYYVGAPTVTFPGGGQAAGTAVVSGGQVTDVTITTGGKYFAPPTVLFSAPAAPADLENIYFNTDGQYAATAPFFNDPQQPVYVPTFQLEFNEQGEAIIPLPSIYMRAVRFVIGVQNPPLAAIINSQGAVSAPTMTSSVDPNHTVFYDFFEYTLDQTNTLFINTSSVDQFGVPIEVILTPADPNVPGGVGVAVSRDTIFGAGPTSFSGYLASMGTNGTSTASAAFSNLTTVEGSAMINGVSYPYRMLAPADYLQLYPFDITITNGGSGYTNAAPSVTFSDPQAPGGVKATATAIVENGVVVGLSFINPGTGYTAPPTVTFSGGSGSGATATAAFGPLNTYFDAALTELFVTNSSRTFQLLVPNPNAGKVTGNATNPNDAGLTNYVFTGTVDAANKKIDFVASINGTPTTLSVSIPSLPNGSTDVFANNGSFSVIGDSGMTLDVLQSLQNNLLGNIENQLVSALNRGIANLSPTGVTFVKITSGGSGYTSAPTISFSGGAGTGATGTAVIANGSVVGVILTNSGTGYTSAPTVSFTGGGGSGAAATAEIAAAGLGVGVTTVAITNGGSGYSSTPSVTFSAPANGGTTATGTAVLTGGVVTGVNITNPGNGYLTAPTVTFSAPGGSGNTTATGTASIGIFDTLAWIGTKEQLNKDHLPYYQPYSTANFYAGYLHANINGTNVSLNDLAYAFAFDDQGNQSSTQAVVNPTAVNIRLGPWSHASGFQTSLWADYYTNSGWSQQLTGDFNGDGKDDIAN
ncbi:MAG: beta strand repeat-containing protein, partial [Gemmataceae bacterium]